MVEFEQLPPKSRSLILATLALDIASRNCRSIFDLALRRNQSVHDVWRDICRKTSQPRCTMPRPLLESQYSRAMFAPAEGAWTAAAPPMSHAVPPQAADAPVTLAPSAIELDDVVALTKPEAAIARRATNAPPHGHRRKAVLMATLAASLMLAIALAYVVIARRPAQTARFDQTPVAATTSVDGPVRKSSAGDKSGADRSAVPEPEGTVRRLEAIGGAFSKR
jgi:hypothetical protein